VLDTGIDCCLWATAETGSYVSEGKDSERERFF
jgi:hypothetical protein